LTPCAPALCLLFAASLLLSNAPVCHAAYDEEEGKTTSYNAAELKEAYADECGCSGNTPCLNLNNGRCNAVDLDTGFCRPYVTKACSQQYASYRIGGISGKNFKSHAGLWFAWVSLFLIIASICFCGPLFRNCVWKNPVAAVDNNKRQQRSANFSPEKEMEGGPVEFIRFTDADDPAATGGGSVPGGSFF